MFSTHAGWESTDHGTFARTGTVKDPPSAVISRVSGSQVIWGCAASWVITRLTAITSSPWVMTYSNAWRCVIPALGVISRDKVFVSRPLVCTTDNQSSETPASQDTLETTGISISPPSAGTLGIFSCDGNNSCLSPACCSMVMLLRYVPFSCFMLNVVLLASTLSFSSILIFSLSVSRTTPTTHSAVCERSSSQLKLASTSTV